MTEASKMYSPLILSDTLKYTCSAESPAGATPRALPDGRILGPSGQVLVPASLSARQAKAAGCLMSGTYGLPSSISSNSFDLALFLESRLQAKLDSRGSTLFKLTWKRRTTPQQRSIFALRASGLRTSVSVYSGVPTPCGQDGPKGGPGQGTDRLPGAAALVSVATPKSSDGSGGRTTKTVGGGNSHLDVQARLASVPTPMTGTPAQNGNNEAGNNDYSRKIVALASVPTPNTPSGGPNSRSTATHTGGMDLEGAASLALLAHCISPQASDANGAGANQNTASLDLQVRLAAAATPAARDYKSNSSTEEFQLQQWNHPRGKPLSAQATLADSGQVATGGTGVTKSSGQLNPEYSRWLQGYPKEWGNCADTVILLSRRSRRKS